MVENSLTKALRDYLSACFKDYALPVKGGGTREPKVLNGYLPPKRANAEDDFPFILVRLNSGETDLAASTVSVSIIVGCYSEEYDGYEWCVNVMSKIRESLFGLPCGTLADKYQFRPGFTWEIFPEQPWPYWQLDIKTQWLLEPPRIDAGEFLAIGEL